MATPRYSKADIHLLHVFSTVVEAKGFSAAQIMLNVSASTISRQISDLETRLGMQLCHRGRGGFRLTDKGAIVYSASRKLFSALGVFGETVDGTRNKLTGKLAIAVVDNYVFNQEARIHETLRSLLEQAPDVSVEMFSLAPDDIEIAVQDGYATLGLGVFHNHKPGLTYQTIGHEIIGLYAGEGHPLFSTTQIKESEKILKDANFARRSYLNEDIIAPVSRDLQSTATAHQIEGIAMLILTGRYIGCLPDTYAETWIRDGKMRSVAGGKYNQYTDIKLVQKRGEKLNLVGKTFLDLLTNTPTDFSGRPE